MSRAEQLYDNAFYDATPLRSSSAQVIVPMIMQWINPGRVVDLGCGRGDWLAVFKQHGVKNILGLDHSGHDPRSLFINESEFRGVNFESLAELGENFDLAVCLEVLEHVNAECAERLVDVLAKAAPVILFSAATPFQRGVNHINLQWHSHWHERFARQGFLALDVIRPRVLGHPQVEWWYRQNVFLLVRASEAENYPNLKALDPGDTNDMRVVHSSVFQELAYPGLATSLQHVLRNLRYRVPGTRWIRPIARLARKLLSAKRKEKQEGPAPVTWAPSARSHWARVVMDQQTRKWVEALNVKEMSALEISGAAWKTFGFKSYENKFYPELDLCQTLPLNHPRYDFIVAEQVFEHLASPLRAVKNVHTLLNPGGSFLITTPFLIMVHEEPLDCTRWTETGLRHLLAEGGFSLESIRTGSWGNPECANANFSGWKNYDYFRHSLENSPQHPVVVWALATKAD